MRAGCAIVLLLQLALSGGALAAPGEASYVYTIPYGKPIEELPGANLLKPAKNALIRSMSIRQEAVTFQLSDPTGQLIKFTAPAYINDATNEPLMFGPTLKLRAGDFYSIKLTNNLVQREADPDPTAWGYHDPMGINIHTHGLHDDTGVNNQATAEIFTGQSDGDNVFVNVEAKKRPEDAPKVLNVNSGISRDHMPGYHWYHPHKHGATAIQTSTSHGVIIVEDNQWWFPWNRGSCGNVWSLLATAPETLLDITLLWFAQSTLGPPLFAADPTYQWVSSEGNTSYPDNPLCCDEARTGYAFRGSATEGTGKNLVIVNGGYKPIVTLYENTWHRWRLLYSGAKGWMVVQILLTDDSGALSVTDRCELQMFARDGVYMLSIPRKVPAVLLAAANRIEMFVRCAAPPVGKRYVLSATNNPDPFNPGQNEQFSSPAYRIIQDVIAEIRMAPSRQQQYARAASRIFATAKSSGARDPRAAQVTAASATPTYNFVEESCTPRRPSYAVDLNNAALEKAGYPLAGIDLQVVNIVSSPLVNNVGCRINNESFIFPDPNPLVMRLGKIVEWSYNDVRWHPFHVHVNPYLVQKIFTKQMLPGTNFTNFYKNGTDFADNFLCPLVGGETPPLTEDDNVRFRFQPGNYTGYAVVHCHFLMHEDIGCMKVVKWDCPGYGAVQPASGTCPGFRFPVKGDI